NELALAVDGGPDQAPASCALNLGLGEFLLSIHELTLHGRGRCEELLHIELATRLHATSQVRSARHSEPTALAPPRHAGAGPPRWRSRTRPGAMRLGPVDPGPVDRAQ